ncbi:multidrug efflux RND transporter permease subunit [Methylobacillus gramineus]|uniref:multidrug efflux RND transporter permease subunit n=1 Tax=Methylobacillus gramineus TaxID=755169 RepID=UPI001CFFB92F|nr:multidrug efflux RND transporter permease subunit [Methylobacillus gramineus]MCB5184917.1 multidrug efflux RND transporter permease subunit [Methylobacillus gramineus]
MVKRVLSQSELKASERSPSALFILRPVMTWLVSLGFLLAGWLAFGFLPVAPLPQVDFPTIVVSASLAGASPETMASSVATPLERSLGRISGISEMTSSSSQGSTSVTLQFELEKDINVAAREVQAAINAAAGMLPTGMPTRPSYRKMNPADMPSMVLTMTSPTKSMGELYDLATNMVGRKIAQVQGVSQVNVAGSSLPAVRVDLNPDALSQQGLSLDDVRTAINAANGSGPKGFLQDDEYSWQIDANDRLLRAKDYRPLIIANRQGAVTRLSDVATVYDSVEDVRNVGFHNNQRAILLIVSRESGANIIEMIDDIRSQLPSIQSSLGDDIKLTVVEDRSPNIRASLHEAEFTLMISVALVILVVYIFLKNGRATLIPALAVPVSLIATFAAMYLCGFSLNNLSLMALIISTGFVVDDAIVVVEHISKRIEQGESPLRASLRGAREVGFTVVAMSVSLVAVFIPLIFMGEITGRLFREFAVTLSVAILISLFVSLTLTPMLCAYLLRRQDARAVDPAHPAVQDRDGFFQRLLTFYRNTLSWTLDHSAMTLVILLFTIAVNVYLYIVIPKGMFPDQDTGRMFGNARADQGVSFNELQRKLEAFRNILLADPAIDQVMVMSGSGRGPGASTNSGNFIIILKDIKQREPVEAIIARLRPKLGEVPGASMFLVNMQDLRIGGRSSDSSYQMTLKSDDIKALRVWEPKVLEAMQAVPDITDVSGGGRSKTVQVYLHIDRAAAQRLGVDVQMIIALLNNSYAQRQISTIYQEQNQYRVVMGVADKYMQSPDILSSLYVVTSTGARVPLSNLVTLGYNTSPSSVQHEGQFASVTFSFNLPEGGNLDNAKQKVRNALSDLKMPLNVQATFSGTAGALDKVLAQMPWLIVAALASVYIVLGMLYESYIHPLTILSTLPSAGVGALLALILFDTPLTLIALIGIILLIGIVKKNAILMIDFALVAEREQGLAPREAIMEACMQRLRPILMTTMAALLGALPLIFGTDGDAPLRRPLGVAIVGGLLVSQLLTLYTTPVIYLYLDRLRHWAMRKRGTQDSAMLESK